MPSVGPSRVVHVVVENRRWQLDTEWVCVGGVDEMQIDDGEPTEPIPGIECPRCGAMRWELASPIRGHRIRVRRWRHSWSRVQTIAADRAELSRQ